MTLEFWVVQRKDDGRYYSKASWAQDPKKAQLFKTRNAAVRTANGNNSRYDRYGFPECGILRVEATLELREGR